MTTEFLTSPKISVKGAVPQHPKDTKVSNVRRGHSAGGPRCPSSAQLRAEGSAWGYPAPGLSEAPTQLPPPRASPGRCSAAPASSAAPGSSSRVRARSPPRWQRSPLRPAGRAPTVPCRAEPPLPAPLGADRPLPDGSRTPSAAFRERGG